jgi:hypothetical protein
VNCPPDRTSRSGAAIRGIKKLDLTVKDGNAARTIAVPKKS